jgi:steroid 5-alpha reductase family enzyme
MTIASLIQSALAAELALAAIMAGAWATQRASGQTGWIDAIWTFGVGATGAALALAPLGVSGASDWRRAAIAGAAALWSARLGLHIVARTRKAPDDPRYRKLIEEWGAVAPRRLFQFLQAQALVGAALALAVALAAQAPSPSWRAQDWAGLLIFAGALLGESCADAQLARFRANPANRGGVCDVGLWRRSRHPNYFFEWLVWVAFAVVAIDRDGASWAAALAPLLMYATLRYASGVPPLEDHLKRTRGERFAAYQARTPIFFPRLF